LLILISSCKQNDSNDIVLNNKLNQQTTITNNENQETKERDTVFLLNEISDNYFYKVYETRESSLYQRLAPDDICDINYIGGIQDTMNTKIVNSINYKKLPKKWNEVIYYNNKFYLNYPSDFCQHKRAQFKNGAFIDFTCEGPWAYNITKINLTNKGDFQITLAHNNNNEPNITISIINEELGIYQWQRLNSKMLVANSEKFQNLPIAMAYCGGNKCPDTIKSQEF